jgi:probable rRNA maturation factor
MIEINNLTSFRVDKKKFSTVAKNVLKGENKETESISLAFVGKKEIEKLNKAFRKKNKPTDVLSFELNEKDCLGEIIICPDIVKENAKKYGVSAQQETMNVFIHGILHLLGYDHEKSEREALIMEQKQEKYLEKLKTKK